MKKNKFLDLPTHLFNLALLVMISLASMTVSADEEHDHKHGTHQSEQHDKGHEGEFVSMSVEMAKINGIKSIIATGGDIREETVLYGKIVPDPTTITEVKARFDGVIKEIRANIGDEVKKDQILLVVESNESLNHYSIKAPYSGRIIARQANIGELTEGQSLLTIANFDFVWAKLAVFPKQLGMVSSEQKVIIHTAEFEQQAKISYLTPSLEDKPYSLAFAKMVNQSNKWPIGAAVRAKIITNIESAALIVPKEAIQEFEGNTVVFVKELNNYHPRVVITGASDSVNVEIIDGLSAGETVISKNSYLLVADLKKSEAGHDH